jgi:hypothetical protein
MKYDTKRRKVSRIKGYILLGTTLFATGLILGSHYYTEFYTSNLIPVVTATEVEKELPMREWVLQELEKNGIDSYEAYRIIKCESGWNKLAINKNRDGSYDIGLWQLNEKWQPSSRECKFDYKCATAQAIKLIKKQGFKPWICSR